MRAARDVLEPAGPTSPPGRADEPPLLDAAPPRLRGEGRHMEAARFRDPPPAADKAAALRLAIARLLVRAPALPVDLAAFPGMRLLDVLVERRRLALVLGRPDPMARLWVGEPAGAAGSAALPATRLAAGALPPAALSATRLAAGALPPAALSVEEVHPNAHRSRRELDLLAARLRASLDPAAVRGARALADELLALPAAVPLAFYRQLVPGVDEKLGLVRTGFRCNQDCGLCWQDRAWGHHPPDQIFTWIEDLRAGGADRLILSGGEPTLDPCLPDYLARARALGYRALTLETNAVLLGRAGAARRLLDAGLTDAFVSLHSGDAATSDRITRAPGTFARTVAGIDALLAAGAGVLLNGVLTREGLDHLASLPDFVADRFAAHPRFLGLTLSQPTDPYDRALLPAILPEPERLRAVLARTLERAFARGLRLRGLDGPCGPPLCAFGADRRITSLAPIPEPLDGRVHLAPCDRCAVRPACFGVRASDAALFGDRCAAPIAPP